MSKNLYIDTNVYLTFYHFTKEDLDELRKIIVLIRRGEIILWLPEQTRNEFYRNRDSKIKHALDDLKSFTIDKQFPRICDQYDELKVMQKALREFGRAKSTLIEKLLIDVESENLLTDIVINELFAHATPIETSDEILEQAVNRYKLGNPPGKDDKYGDAVNWESLLETVKSGDLYFVSDDKDYYSVLDKDRFNKFLFNEWETTNGTEIRWYRTLSEFCKSNFPDIDIASEKEKESIINELISTSSFADSKGLVRKLIKFDNFSSKQINDIANAFVSNPQLHWIKGDYPINELVTLIKSNRGKLDDSIRENFVRRLEEPQPF